MTQLSLLAVAAAAPKHLDPLALFLQADIVVQAVMVGLVLASLWVWAIIVGFSLRHARLTKACDAYEREFWKASDIDAFQAEHGGEGEPAAELAAFRIGELAG